jgi:hypothetical protein
MTLKQQVHRALVSLIDQKIMELEVILNETIEATSSDSKSSAGDKHETGVAMAQLEQEKLSKQLNELLIQKNKIKTLNPEIAHVKIGLGSLVETNNGWYYFSIGYGLITINNESIYTLNPNAPLGQAMLGKVTGDNVIFQSKSIQILNVC